MGQRSLRAAAIAAFVFIGGAIISGIIGGRADALFIWLWELVTNAQALSFLPWIVVLILVIILCIVVGFWMNARTNWKSKEANWQSKEAKWQLKEQILSLDDRFLRFVASLASLMSTDDLSIGMQKLINALERDVISVFDGKITEAVLLCPDADKKLLTRWNDKPTPSNIIRIIPFNIDNKMSGTKEPKGMAVNAWFNNKIYLVHIDRQDGKQIADQDDYIFPQSRVSYESCVCVPVDAGNERLGVLCLNSPASAFFDDAVTNYSELQETLIVLATRFASALEIYKKLQSSRQSQQAAEVQS